MSEVLLTVKQAAALLQVHPLTVRRQLRAGKLRGVRRGQLWRVPESALYEASPETHRTPGDKSPTQSCATTGNQETEQAEAIWRELTSSDGRRHNAAIIMLGQAPEALRRIVMQRSSEAAARYYATPAGEVELTDWRALDGEPFHDDEGAGDSP